MDSDPGGPHPGVFVYPPSPPYRPRWWLHILLFALTLLTTTFFGALFTGELPEALASLPLDRLVLEPRFILQGLAFSIPLLIILVSHEMGHYVACRLHGLAATPPYFIPVPFGIGTMGAVIRIKEPLRNKRQLLDVGAAGPIAGFVVMLPFLVWGIATSRIAPLPQATEYLYFGEPVLFKVLAHLLHPGMAPGQDLLLGPVGFAAWFGLLVTALNMLPFAQLDGGHIAYALFGRWHRRFVWPLWSLLFILGFRWIGWWIWAVIALVMGVRHPRLWDEDLPLDPRRRAIAWIAFLIFLLCFMPQPIVLVS
ncbi:MAG: site-2 protease family protein [Acidobacteria bacterium]|nr:site-2 protease family protein [Acidobacteriota bacterium]